MSESDNTAHKKLRVGDAPQPIPLAPLSYSDEEREALRSSFANAEPFPHLTVTDLCDDAFLRTVRDEVIAQLKADYKETDIFKVLQTGDLANLDTSNKEIQSLLALRDAIYSSEFRSFVQEVTGCPQLTQQVDCSCNIYPESGHLLCHDDVIGSRCVSYIIYLTDPETEWLASHGGALELYRVNDSKEPDHKPAKRILPQWNQMVFFCTEPDVSFHSVEEVRTADNHRLSISGWFHTSADHARIAQSSLHQIQSEAAPPPLGFTFQQRDHGIGTRFNFRLFRKANILGESLQQEIVDDLKKWVNPIYLEHAHIEQIYETFKEEGSIQLRDFLNGNTIEEAMAAVAAADEEVRSGRDADHEGWIVKGPPHKRRHLQFSGYEIDKTSSATGRIGALLRRIETEVFQSEAFYHLLHQLTGVTLLGGDSEARCFRPGSDYTIALYSSLKKETLDAVLCFVHCPDEAALAQWDLGEVGGFEAYLLADTKEESAADVYRADDDDSGVLSVSPVSNTLNLVLSDTGLIKFVKYVGAAAPGCRWDVSAEYRLDESIAMEDDEEPSDAEERD